MSQSFKAFLMVLPLLAFSSCFKSKVDKKLNNENSRVLSQALEQENVVPVAIIGSGPAGLTSALYIARAGMKAFVFAGALPRGQLTETTTVENWPGRENVQGPQLMADIEAQALSFGADIIHDKIIDIDFISWPFKLKTEDGRSFKAMAIILATGATPKKLNVPGEHEFWGGGVTTCAVCDAPGFRGKEVVVSGGGDSAIEMVYELAPYVKKVTILVRKDSMRAAIAGQKRVAAISNAVIEYNKEITQIYGENDRVIAIDVLDNKTNIIERRSIDGVFVAVGHMPNNAILKNGIDLDEHGYLVMQGRSQCCSIPGVFAAGEIQDPSYRQAIVAAGEGAKAALDAASFLYELGFNVEIGEKLDKKFFETFSDEKLDLREITENSELDELIINSKGLVILDFYAHHCPGCIRMIPVLEAVASKLEGKVTILKADHDKVKKTIYKTLWFDHDVKIRKVPSLVVFKDGKHIETNTKIMSKPELFEYISRFL